MFSFSKKTCHFFGAALGALFGLLASPALASSVFVTNTNDSGAGSLRQAILDANSLGGSDTIFFSSSIDGGTITLLSNLPALTDLADFSILTPTSITITGGNFALDQNLPIGAAGLVAFDGAFSSTGSLTMQSNFRFLLNGISSSYAGGMTVFDGELIIGDVAHSTAVFGDGTNTTTLLGGTLSGHGTVNMNVTNNSGTVSPGSGTIGTLAVGGNYVQGSGATLAITVSPTTASKLAVAGTAALDGRLVVTFNPGTYVAKTFTVLTAGTVTGTFSSVNLTAPAGLAVSALNYNPTSVTFDVLASATQTDVFSTFAFPTISAAHQAGETIFDHLGGVGGGTQNNPMSFASLTQKGVALEENTQGLNHLVKGLPNAMKQYGGWFKATGNLASLESSGAGSGYDSETGGFMFGVDREVEKGLRIGAAGGYEHTSITATNSASTGGESNTGRFGLYGSKELDDNISVHARLGYALHMIDTERLETNNGLIGRSSHDGHEFSSGLQLSKKINMHGYTFTPKAGLSYVLLAEDGYTETGAGIFNATVSDKDTHSLRLITGLTVARPTTIREWDVTPEARIKYSYETLDAISATTGTVLGTGFSSKGVTPSSHMLAIGFGTSVKLDETVDAFGSYDVNLPTGNTFEQTFALGVKMKF
ncbi:MAG: autotransporter outer membrane beta-barrel domain-containing protein [Alphaproteobacteria bacterium]|nr:autotransporter outer membrane beta-barrel domain-containing protein [Alphaproteobacteria bacterium]